MAKQKKKSKPSAEPKLPDVPEIWAEPATSDEPYQCILRLDSCEPESLPVPGEDDGNSHENILITGRFANASVDNVTVVFASKNAQGGFDDDKLFVQDGKVKRIQFNKIQVPVVISPKAMPGTRFFTVTHAEVVDDDMAINCIVANVDLSFRLT